MNSTAAIFLVVFVSMSNDMEATRKAAEAYAAQEKIDKALDRYQQIVFTREQRDNLGAAAAVTRVVIERRVVARWEF